MELSETGGHQNYHWHQTSACSANQYGPPAQPKYWRNHPELGASCTTTPSGMQQLGQTAKLVATNGCKIKKIKYIEIHIKMADISDLSYMSEYKKKCVCRCMYPIYQGKPMIYIRLMESIESMNTPWKPRKILLWPNTEKISPGTTQDVVSSLGLYCMNAWWLIRCNFYFTSISLLFHFDFFDFTWNSLRFHFDFTSIPSPGRKEDRPEAEVDQPEAKVDQPKAEVDQRVL